MADPIIITTASTHYFEVGMVLHVSGTSGRGKTYRIVEVVSPTQIRVERPWWMPLWTVWSAATAPFRYVWRRLRLYL